MANPEHIAMLAQGVEAWNKWRAENYGLRPDLMGANLEGVDLSGVNFFETYLSQAKLSGANLSKANLIEAVLTSVDLTGAKLISAELKGVILDSSDCTHADFTRAKLRQARLEANFTDAILNGAFLRYASLVGANLRGAKLAEADLSEANLKQADLTKADLRGANLTIANLVLANFSNADLTGANLTAAACVRTCFDDATLTGCRVHGVAAWDVGLLGAKQEQLLISPLGAADITVDDLEVAQFLYLLVKNQKIRNVIDTIGNKAVLILGRFTERKEVLEAIRAEIRRHRYLPIVFDFERPVDRDFSETVMTLAGMSRFIIADITRPKSVPLELQMTVPNYMVPFVPILQSGEEPFSMFRDLWQKHRDWVLDLLSYDSIDTLVRVFDKAIVGPANERLAALRVRKDEGLRIRRAEDYG